MKGGTLTAAEQKALKESRTQAADPAAQIVAEGLVIMQKIRNIIEKSRLTEKAKQEIFEAISALEHE